MTRPLRITLAVRYAMLTAIVLKTKDMETSVEGEGAGGRVVTVSSGEAAVVVVVKWVMLLAAFVEDSGGGDGTTTAAMWLPTSNYSTTTNCGRGGSK